MKKLIFYAGMMIAVIIFLPMVIVKGCGKSPEPVPAPEEPEVVEERKIRVYNASQESLELMNLEEYIMGVVAAEMPADFDIEALKAQAVAARTYAYGRVSGVYRSKQGDHDDADICTDSSHCQAWVSKENAMKKWGALFAARNWSKIEKAVKDTKDMIVVYNGSIANTLFHASSCGRTENAEDVWPGVSVPYLRSVPSEGDEASKGYITSIVVKSDDMLRKLLNAYPESEMEELSADDIKVLDYTEGGRVKNVKVGDIAMKGTEFRKLFGLRSACFEVEQAGKNEIKITTKGFGHGVGMSQWGANSLAKKGGTYNEILRHYYTGVDIMSIQEYEELTS